MKLKIENFWKKDAIDIVQDINDSLKRMEIEPIHKKLNQLFEILQDTERNSKERVSLCFILEKIADFEPFFPKIIEFFIELLDEEKDPHMKEFAVYILGNLAITKPTLALITQTLPIFVKFCEDSSEYVRTCAEDIKNQLHVVKESKIKEKEAIIQLQEDLRAYIKEKIEDLNDRANNISKEALNLDYEAAYNTQDLMVEKIHKFSDVNQTSDDDIRTFIKKQTKENPIFEGEFKDEYKEWKNIWSQKEDLIRKVHCILRIQSKIFNIINFIKEKGEKGDISIEELKDQTTGGLRNRWSNDEIIETLEKLVEEEIIPNLFLQQVKDLKGIMGSEKKNKEK